MDLPVYLVSTKPGVLEELVNSLVIHFADLISGFHLSNVKGTDMPSSTGPVHKADDYLRCFVLGLVTTWQYLTYP